MCPMCGWLGGWATLFWIFSLVAVIVGVVFLFQALLHRGGGTGSRDDRVTAEALRILAERYARGEIDREEFEERRRALTS